MQTYANCLILISPYLDAAVVQVATRSIRFSSGTATPAQGTQPYRKC